MKNIMIKTFITMNKSMKTCKKCKNINDATRNGHIKCLERLHKLGCKRYYDWDLACQNAAMNGHLDCLQYAHKNGCPWNERTCTYAARNGHLDCLQYARKNGCPWDKEDVPSQTDNTDDQCSICLGNMQKVQYKPCNHRFCIVCTNTLIDDVANDKNIKIRCALCRADVVENVLLDN